MVQYTYNAWGEHTVSGTQASTIGAKNPFRYRSYFYDTETGLYFLKTKYYDPQIGRFLNMDSVAYADPETINGLNLYAYCGNNPVMNVDPTGHDHKSVFSTIMGLLNPLSKATAEGAIIVAVFKGKFSELKSDWNNGCFNPFNQSESVALKSKVFSFYKGESVVRHFISDASSCQVAGTIFLKYDETNNADGIATLNHEYGHGIQEKCMGLKSYLFRIALPSVITYFVNPNDDIYYSMPWERTADYYGGVSRGISYKSGSLAWGFVENIVGPIVIPFYFIFGF